MRVTRRRGKVTTSPEVPTDAPDWARFPGSGPLQEWALELRHACSATDAAGDPWELTARAAIVIGKDVTSCAGALRRVAADAGMRFISVDADDVCDLAPSTVFSVEGGDVRVPAAPVMWRRSSPVLVHLQRGRWMLEKSEGEDADVVASMRRFQSCLATWIRAFDRKHPVVVVTSADDIREMAESLRRVGLFDRFFGLPAPTMEAFGRDFIERIGTEQCGESITESPGKVGKLVSTEYETERRQGLAVLRLRRLIARENRPLEFIDLVKMYAHGFAEAGEPPADAEDIRRQVAYHEAGHAVVAVVDSDGHNVPEYSSIVPSAHFKGVVVESYTYQLDAGDRKTYADLRQKVRINLAGRAAEELVFGPEGVSNGATEDLKKATGNAGTAFAFWGFAPSMEKEGQAGSNLLVAGMAEDEFTASEAAHIEGLVREFLAVEYRAVKEMLTAHRPLLDAIADRLMWDPIVDQDALAELVRTHVPIPVASRPAPAMNCAPG